MPRVAPKKMTKDEEAAYDKAPAEVYVYWCRDCRHLLHVSFSRYEYGAHVTCSCPDRSEVVDSYKHYKRETA